jgi:undecaprenyl-phosphate 4-deoxy-4-formamido-L-arabinose transferase
MESHPSLAVSIVVPVYRSAPILPELVARTGAVMAETPFADSFELVLVCDASPDRSWEAIEEAAAGHAFVRGVLLRRNAGQHNATMAGLHHARGRRIVIMDDDLQHPPDAIPRMLRTLDDGYDVCYTRYVDRKHPLWKRFGSAVNDRAARLLLGKPRDLYLSSFKALDHGVAREILRYDGPFAYVDGLILDVTRHITTVDIEHGARVIRAFPQAHGDDVACHVFRGALRRDARGRGGAGQDGQQHERHPHEPTRRHGRD